jgi:poly(3-hydroxybutyrate) depolymerase
MSKLPHVRLLAAAFALLGAALVHEPHARATTDLPNNNLFSNFTMGNQPGSEGVVYTTQSVIDYPNRTAATRRRVSYMVPVGFNAQRTPVVTGLKYPLIIALHGGNGDGANFATTYFSNLLGSGYAFVLPSAATWGAAANFQTVGTGGTNCDGGVAGARSNANVTGVDCLEDLKFLEYLIDGIVKSNPQIDTSKIFIWGWSNGSGLMFTSLCWGSEFTVNSVPYAVAGYAAVGKGLGGVKQELGCGNASALPISFPAAFGNAAVGFTGIPATYGLDMGGNVVPLYFHFGLLDNHVFCQAYDAAGNCINGPDDPMTNASQDDASETMNYFRIKHGLNTSFLLSSIADADSDGVWAETIRTHRTTAGTGVFSWAPAAGTETPIRVVRITNGGHAPSSVTGVPPQPDQCHDFDWSQKVVDYFSIHAGLRAGPY